MEAHIERLDDHLAGMEERRRQWQTQDAPHAQEQEARPADTPEAIRARLDAEMRTTIADVQRWVGRTSHPTWIHAAYADLATRLARVEDGLEQVGCRRGRTPHRSDPDSLACASG